MEPSYVYSYTYQVKRLAKDTLCSDCDLPISERDATEEHRLEKFRFAILDLNQPDPVQHLVQSLMQKLFQQTQPSNSSSNEPALPPDHQRLLSLKITEVASAALANGVNNHRPIQILVVFTIKRTIKRHESDDGNVIVGKECVICLEKFKSEFQVVEFPCDCKCFFHNDCAKTWVKNNPSCPICRFSVARYL